VFRTLFLTLKEIGKHGGGVFVMPISEEQYCNKEWLENFYIKKGLSAKSCGEIIGVSDVTILRWLKKYNIKTRKPGGYCHDRQRKTNKKYLSEEWLIENYTNNEYSAAKCAQLGECSATRIFNLLKKYNVPSRGRHELRKHHESSKKYELIIMPKEILIEYYIHKELSIENCAKALGLGYKAIRKQLIKNNIEIRPPANSGYYKGAKNKNWNPDRTKSDRATHREYVKYRNWRTSVYQRDKFTCQCCKRKKSGQLVAHHLYGYADNEELKIQIDNGVTLCRECHKEFHKTYGYKNNTLKHFAEFMEAKGKQFTIKQMQLKLF